MGLMACQDLLLVSIGIFWFTFYSRMHRTRDKRAALLSAEIIGK